MENAFETVDWYAREKSGGQGLVIEEGTGRNVAVTYEAKDAPLVAAAPRLARIAHELGYGQTTGARMNEIMRECREILAEMGEDESDGDQSEMCQHCGEDRPLGPPSSVWTCGACNGLNPGETKEAETVFINHYTCPACGEEWQDEWTAQVDDDCPACGERHISPHESEEAGSMVFDA